MYNGWLIYNEEDYIKNTFFVEKMIEYGKAYDMNIKLVLTKNISTGFRDGKLFAEEIGIVSPVPDFVVNRSRDDLLGFQFELLGCSVFNSSFVTRICNDKARTHQFVNILGINSVKTLFCRKDQFNKKSVFFDYPVVIKSVSGHGGSEVFRAENGEELDNIISGLRSDEFIVQEMCGNPGIDIRVFIIGKKIIGAVKRTSLKDFRSNFSLGGSAGLYELKDSEKELVSKIINNFDFGFAGIDFILDKDNNFIFNEIEDVVGSRTLYANSDIDAIKLYTEYIHNKLCS